MDFCHSGYHDQVSCAADMSVTNLSNYGHFFINFECLLWYLREECGDVCCDISEKNVLILFIFGTMINNDRARCM